ncbi:MAG: LacI family DNA-binding transcriptional regulator [Spirochaetales bacterium]|nr:LacI family DNA-binding transcriptional regulator [Spirochaetales bacterium]
MSTINDVAKEAGVSIATVSRYLNSKENVSAQKAKSIEAAVRKLNYQIDSAAQSLKTGKSYRIGLISPATGPHYWEIISSLENTLVQSNYYMRMIFTREPKYNIQRDEILSKIRDVDGSIIMPLENKIDKQVIKALIREKLHFVLVDGLTDNKNIYQVGVDNFDIGKTAAEILLKAGHREFLLLTGIEDLSSSYDRILGFRQALKEYHIELPEERCIPGDFNPRQILDFLEQDFSKLPPFTAVFSSNDLMALAFIKAAEQNNKLSPRDFSIIGVDDLDILPYLSPGLSTFRQPLQIMGTIAANMLVSQVEGYNLREKQVVLKAQYIERETVAEVK